MGFSIVSSLRDIRQGLLHTTHRSWHVTQQVASDGLAPQLTLQASP